MTSHRKYNIKPLHWTFNTNNRVREVDFFKNVLGMTVLKHQESSWASDKQPLKVSRTLMGYGSMPDRFIIELRYLQGAPDYKPSSDLIGITIVSKTAIARAKAVTWPIREIQDKLFRLSSPQGYVFHLINEATPTECDPIKEICLRSSFLISTVNYWTSTFGATVFHEYNGQTTLSFGDDTCKIRFVESADEVVREPGYGRLTLAMPRKQLELLEYRSLEENKPLEIHRSIDMTDATTPCHVLVLRAPDDYEVVFVEEDVYTALSATDPNAGNALDLAIQKFDRLSRNSDKN